MVIDHIKQRREREMRKLDEQERKRREATHITAKDSSEEEVEKVADAVLTASEVSEARGAGISAREYIKREFGVDASDYQTDQDLLAAISESQKDG